MLTPMNNLYLWIKALHIISVISWMAGMLYLPRLFVYHTRVRPGSEADELFKIMERKLLRVIINPAMIATFIFGIWLIMLGGIDIRHAGWLHIKILLVLILAGISGLLSRYRKDFSLGQNRKSERFYRCLNEIPAVIMVVIVLLAVVKPF